MNIKRMLLTTLFVMTQMNSDFAAQIAGEKDSNVQSPLLEGPGGIPVATVQPQTTSAQSAPMPPAPSVAPIAQPAPVAQAMPSAPALPMPMQTNDTSVTSSLPQTTANPTVNQPNPEPLPKKTGAHIMSGVNFKTMEESDQDVIDTVNVKSTSGNWVYKNYWWRKIQELYEQIKASFNEIMTSRMVFFTKRSEVDKELDRFYQHIGLEQGPLEDIINLALEIMAKEEKDQGFLNKKERAFLEKVKNKKYQLEQLREDVKAIEDLDRKIDEALEVVLQQVDICNKYEQEAWTTFKNVARELSDKEARKQYYDTKGLLDDINEVYNYLTGSFTTYFDQMAQSVQDHTQSIIAKMGALKSDEIDLQKEAEKFEQEDEEFEEKLHEKKHTAQKEKSSVIQKTKGVVTDLWQKIIQFVKKIMSYFGLSFDKVVKEEKQAEKRLEDEYTTVKETLEKDEQDAVTQVRQDVKNMEEFFGETLNLEDKKTENEQEDAA